MGDATDDEMLTGAEPAGAVRRDDHVRAPGAGGVQAFRKLGSGSRRIRNAVYRGFSLLPFVASYLSNHVALSGKRYSVLRERSG